MPALLLGLVIIASRKTTTYSTEAEVYKHTDKNTGGPMTCLFIRIQS